MNGAGVWHHTFFDELPQDYLSFAEEELRAALVDTVSELADGYGCPVRFSLVAQQPRVRQAKADLQLPEDVSLAAWIQRRLNGLALEATDTGLGSDLTLRLSGQVNTGTLFPELNAQVPVPPTLASMTHPVEKAAQTPQDLGLEFLAGLPLQEFAPEELDLRQAILHSFSALLNQGHGPVLNWQSVCQSEKVQEAQTILLPPGVSVSAWICKRLSHEILLSNDTEGQIVASLAPGVLDELPKRSGDAMEAAHGTCGESAHPFFDQLPQDSLSPAEQLLQKTLMDTVRELAGEDGCAVRLSLVAQRPAVRLAKADLQLPPGVSLTAWIQRRLRDIALEVPDSALGSDLTVRLCEDGQSAAPPATWVPRASEAAPSPMGRVTTLAAAEDTGEPKMKKSVHNFLSSLPSESFTREELNLRQSILNSFAALVAKGHGPVMMSVLCRPRAVQLAKFALLPRDVPVAAWIAHRLKHEIYITEDDKGEPIAELAPSTLEAGPISYGQASKTQLAPDVLEAGVMSHGQVFGTRAEDSITICAHPPQRQHADLQSFFQGPLRPEEQRLHLAVVAAMTFRQDESHASDFVSMNLTDLVNQDANLSAAWSAAKHMWLAMQPRIEVCLSQWIQYRLSDEVHLHLEPYVQFCNANRPPAKRKASDFNKQAAVKHIRIHYPQGRSSESPVALRSSVVGHSLPNLQRGKGNLQKGRGKSKPKGSR